MVAVAQKAIGSRLTESDSGTAELEYIISGATDPVEAKLALMAWADAIYDGKIARRYEVEEFAPGVFDGRVQYGLVTPREPGTRKFSFDTGGGTQNVTQSQQTTRYAPEGGTAPDFHGAIGVTKTAVEGVEIPVPSFEFQITETFEIGVLTPGYIYTLFTLTGTTNDRQFNGFAPGELLFLGASANSQDAETVEITFKFSASPNVEGLTIGDITGINKRGWDYLWVLYEDEEDEDASALVKRPVAVYVERVHREGNYGLLGL